MPAYRMPSTSTGSQPRGQGAVEHRPDARVSGDHLQHARDLRVADHGGLATEPVEEHSGPALLERTSVSSALGPSLGEQLVAVLGKHGVYELRGSARGRLRGRAADVQRTLARDAPGDDPLVALAHAVLT